MEARCCNDWLKDAEHPLHALSAFVERPPPTAQIVRMNRKGVAERVIGTVEALAPDGFHQHRRRDER